MTVAAGALRFVYTIIPNVFIVLDAAVVHRRKKTDKTYKIIGLVTVRGNPTDLRRSKVRGATI